MAPQANINEGARTTTMNLGDQGVVALGAYESWIRGLDSVERLASA